MEQTLVTIHSIIRWLVLLIGFTGVIRSALALSRSSIWMGMDRGLSAAYTGMIDLQILVGIVLMIVVLTGPARSVTVNLIAHPIVMIIAAGVAHMNRRFRNAPDRDRSRGQLGLYVGSLVLIIVGILIAPSVV